MAFSVVFALALASGCGDEESDDRPRFSCGAQLCVEGAAYCRREAAGACQATSDPCGVDELSCMAGAMTGCDAIVLSCADAPASCTTCVCLLAEAACGPDAVSDGCRTTAEGNLELTCVPI